MATAACERGAPYICGADHKPQYVQHEQLALHFLQLLIAETSIAAAFRCGSPSPWSIEGIPLPTAARHVSQAPRMNAPAIALLCNQTTNAKVPNGSLHRYPVQRHAAATPCRRLPLPSEPTPRQCPRGRAHDSTASLDEPVLSRVCPPPYRGHVRPGVTLRPSPRASIVEAGRAPYRARCAHRHGPSWVEQGPAPPQRQGRLAQPLACPPGLAAARPTCR